MSDGSVSRISADVIRVACSIDDAKLTTDRETIVWDLSVTEALTLHRSLAAALMNLNTNLAPVSGWVRGSG